MIKKYQVDYGEGYQFHLVLDDTYRSLYKLRERELNKEGVFGRQMEVMAHIDYLGDEATPTAIARRMNHDTHAISQIVRRLVSGGIVLKSRRTSDKRSVSISLTEKGHTLYHEARKKNILIRVLSQLPKRKRSQLITLLSELRTIVRNELGYEAEDDNPI
jgi:DNA-binding MarR family transcriptional regulator